MPIEAILDKETPIIITEGCKKAIKATQEGFYCVAVAGVNNWKMKPKENNGEESDDIDEVADIIPDIKNWDIEGKTIILCFDSDLWEKEQVKQALYEFACYLIGEKKAKVKTLLLPKGKDKGLDDFLKNRGKQEFEKLLKQCPYITLKEIQRTREFPLWHSGLRSQLVSTKIRIQSLALFSGLGIQHCHELWCRSQTWLRLHGSHDVAVA